MQLSRATAWEGVVGTVLLAVVGGIIATSPPRQALSKRGDASSPPLVKERARDSSFVHARTWEDPLLAVSEVQGSDSGENRWSDGDVSQATTGAHVTIDPCGLDQLKQDSAGKVGKLTIVLQEMLGGPGLEDEESRRAERIAMTEALLSTEFAPVPPESAIGRLELLAPRHPGLGARLAYQWFVREGERCLLVFVPDQLLNDAQSLGRAASIGVQLSEAVSPRVLDRVVLSRRSTSGLTNDLVYASIVGPPLALGKGKMTVLNVGSTVGIDHVGKSVKNQVQAELSRGKLKKLQVPMFNMSIRAFCNGAIEQWVSSARRRESRNASSMIHPINGWGIGRVLGSDAQLVGLLRTELALRRAGVDNPRNEIAIISEVDSPYGTAFAKAFKPTEEDREDAVRIISFPSGLDIAPRSAPGRTAYQQFEAKADRLKAQGVPIEPTTPLGQQQIDYVYRHLAHYEAGLRAVDKRLAAVVICAADVFDKRPLIQLTRARFPDALIMTTDLHALMLDPADYDVMRNVVVASHLDLHSGKEAQDKFAPFRSCYQTSLFLGVKRLFTHSASLPAWATTLDTMAPTGRVYEISRRGPVLLDSRKFPDHELYPRVYDQPVLGAIRALPFRRIVEILCFLAILVLFTRHFDSKLRAGARRGGIVPTATSDAATEERDSRNRDLRAKSIVVRAVHRIAAFLSSRDVGVAALIIAPIVFLVLLLSIFVLRAGSPHFIPQWLPSSLLLAIAGSGVVSLIFAFVAGAPLTTVRITWLLIGSVITSLALVGGFGVGGAGENVRAWVNWCLYALVGLMGVAALALLNQRILSREVHIVDVTRQSVGASPDPLDPAARKPVEPVISPWQKMHSAGMRWIALSVLAAAGGFVLVALGSGYSGEPWGWLDGVSAWPSEIVRLVAVLAGIVFIVLSSRAVAELWQHAAGMQELFHADERGPVLSLLNATPGHPAQGSKARGWQSSLKRVSVVDWACPVQGSGREQRIDIATLLRQFRYKCLLKGRGARLSLLGACLGAAILGAIATLDIPLVPVRGVAAYCIHLALMVALAIVINLVTLITWDASHICSRFVNQLAAFPSRWPEEFRSAAARTTGVSTRFVDSWLDIQSIARISAVANSLMYYPMILIVLSAVAWHRRVDAWSFGALFVVLYGLSLSVCILAAYSLRRSAEHARRREVDRLNRQLAELDRFDAQTAERCDSVKPGESCEVELKFGPNPRQLYVELLRVIGTEDASPDDPHGVEPRTAMIIARHMAAPAAAPLASRPEYCGQSLRLKLERTPEQNFRIFTTPGNAVLADHDRASISGALHEAATKESRTREWREVRSAQRAQIRAMIEQIEATRHGAFAPWTEDPLFRAVAMPIIGLVSIKFAEWVNAAVR